MISESQRLKARGADCWAAAVAHPMVAEIGAGSLPHATFRFYFEQNLGYLREYARAIAFAATATTDRGALSTLARFLGQIVDVEIPANEAFLERLGGSAARLKGSVTMLPNADSRRRVPRQGMRCARKPASRATQIDPPGPSVEIEIEVDVIDLYF